jgi:hypothetical protein
MYIHVLPEKGLLSRTLVSKDKACLRTLAVLSLSLSTANAAYVYVYTFINIYAYVNGYICKYSCI